jgi:hypothetical protein
MAIPERPDEPTRRKRSRPFGLTLHVNHLLADYHSRRVKPPEANVTWQVGRLSLASEIGPVVCHDARPWPAAVGVHLLARQGSGVL